MTSPAPAENPQVNPLEKNYALDLAERVGATAAEAAIALVIVEGANWDVWWAAPLMMVLATLKGGLGKLVGHKDSASVAPSV